MMDYKIGRSNKSDFVQAVDEAAAGLHNPKLIIFFTPVQGFEEYTRILNEKFPETIVIGQTTYVGLCKSGAYKEGILLLGIESGIECAADVLEEADKYPIKYVKRIKKCVKKMSSTENTVCMEYTTSLTKSEELVLTTLNSVLEDKDITVCGGSAGNDTKVDTTRISLNGKVYNKACVFVLIRNLNGKIHFYRENIYKPTKQYFIATKVDVRNRIVYEYDNKPAAQVIADALGTTVSNLGKYLDSRPMGRVIGDEMYITANNRVVDGNAMEYHAKVYENGLMALLEPDDYRAVISRTMEKIKKEVPHPSLALMVHCLARSLLFEGEGYLNEYAQKMGEVLDNYIGSSGYGEQLRQEHFNQTMVVAVFE